MAVAVEYREFTPKNSRDDLIRKVQNAPEEHAEAVLNAYELMQRLHDKGVIDLANGLLSAGDTVVDKVVDLVSSKEAVNALRIALMLGNVLTKIEPNLVSAVLNPPKADPPSMWQIARQAMSKESRTGLATAVGLLRAFGIALRR